MVTGAFTETCWFVVVLMLTNSTCTTFGSGFVTGAVYVAPTSPCGIAVPIVPSPWRESFTYHTRVKPAFELVNGTVTTTGLSHCGFTGAARQSSSPGPGSHPSSTLVHVW